MTVQIYFSPNTICWARPRTIIEERLTDLGFFTGGIKPETPPERSPLAEARGVCVDEQVSAAGPLGGGLRKGRYERVVEPAPPPVRRVVDVAHVVPRPRRRAAVAHHRVQSVPRVSRRPPVPLRPVPLVVVVLLSAVPLPGTLLRRLVRFGRRWRRAGAAGIVGVVDQVDLQARARGSMCFGACRLGERRRERGIFVGCELLAQSQRAAQVLLLVAQRELRQSGAGNRRTRAATATAKKA